MNKKIIVIVVVCVAIAGLALYYFKPFRGTGEQTTLIPIGASVVVSFDLESLTKKADLKDKFKGTKLYKKITESKGAETGKDVAAIVSRILENPKKCGLDLSSDAYFFRHYHTDHGDKYGLVIGMNDHKEFGEFLKAIPGMKDNITDKKTYQLLTGDKHFLAWNDKGLLVIIDEKRSMDYLYYESSRKDADNKSESYINELMTMQTSKSIRVKPEFQRFARQGNDVGFFVNYGKSLEEESQNQYNPLASVFKMFNGLYFRGGLDFEKNKIVAKGQFDGKEEVLKTFNYLKRDGISSKALQYVAGEHLFMTAGINLDINRILGFVKDNFGKVGLEAGLQQMGLTQDELVGMVTGEVTISLIDIKQVEVPDYDYRINPITGMFERFDTVRRELSPVFIANLGISDKKGFHKVLNKIFGEPDHDMYHDNFGRMPIYIVDNSFGVSIVNDKTLAESILKGKGTKEPPKDIGNMMADQPGSFYFDLNVKHYPTAAIDKIIRSEDKKDQFTKFMALFEDYKGYGTMESFRYEINLVQGEENSLFRILKQCDVLELDKPKEEPKATLDPYVDTIMETPPPIAEPEMIK